MRYHVDTLSRTILFDDLGEMVQVLDYMNGRKHGHDSHDLAVIAADLLKIDKKILAIKVIRQLTKWDLKTAKEFVDGIGVEKTGVVDA